MMVAQFQCFPSPLMWCQTSIAPDAVAGLQRWFRAEDLTGANVSPFATWTDTAAIQNAVQAVGTSRPTLNHNGAFNYIRYDGVDDFMDYGELLNARTVFAVVRYWNTATDGALIFGHETVYDFHGGHAANSDQGKVLSATLCSQWLRWTDTLPHSRALLNGVPTAPTTSINKPPAFAVLAFRAVADVRCQNFANDRAGSLAPIDLMEAVLYSAELSDAQMDGVAAWLKNKFAAYV